jgi:AcrR family transcriptional regulator
MTKDIEPMAARKPRADGERNRQRLLEAAKEVFAEKGSQGSLEEIARRAGVGIGTLYRHFPARDALVAAVFRNEVEQLAAAAQQLTQTHPPLPALREWMLRFVDFMATKYGMSEVFESVVCASSDLHAEAGTQINDIVEALAQRAVANGDIHLGIAPLDVLRALAGVANISPGPDWERAARQLVDILLQGLSVRR